MWYLDKPEGLWFDEMQTYIEAKMPLQDILKVFFTEHIHAPLFYIILHFWMGMFGENDLILRVLPVIFGTLTIPAVYLCVNELYKPPQNPKIPAPGENRLKCKKTALLAAFLTAINSLLIYYSQEVRFYSLVGLFSSLIFLFLLRINNNPRKLNIIGLVLSNAGLLYTHSISFVFVFFEFLIFGLYFFRRKKKAFKALVISALITFTIYSPFLYNLYNLLEKGIKSSGVIAQWWAQFTFSKLLFVLQDSFSPFLIAYANPPGNYFNFVFQSKIFAAIFLIFVFLPFIAGIYGILTSVVKNRLNLLILLVCSGFTIVFAIACSMGKVVCVSRYLIEITPVFIILSAYGLMNLRNNIIKKTLIGFIISINLFFLLFMPLSAPKNTRKLGFKPAADILESYKLTDKDYFILIGNKKRLFHKYFQPSKSDSFFCIHNWNILLMPFFLSNEASLKDITDFGYYQAQAKLPAQSEKKRDFFIEKVKSTGFFREYKKHNNYKKFCYDYCRGIIKNNKNIFIDSKLEEEIFSKINKKNSLVIIIFKGLVIYPDISEIKKIAQKDEKAYKDRILMYMLNSRVAYDLLEYAGQEMQLKNKESSLMWDIYIFKRKL